jgi:hypothetical protein
MSSPVRFVSSHPSRRLAGAVAVVLLVAAGMTSAQQTKAPPGAAAPGDKGELWETTIKMEMAGFAMPPQTQKMCLGKEASDQDRVPTHENCTVTESKRVGSTFRFKMVCTGKDAMTGDGEFTYTADGYDGKMHMKMKEGEMTQTISARKRGECTGTVQAQSRQLQAQAKEQQAQGAAQIAEVCAKGLNSLQTEFFFGQGAMCADRKDAFCGEVGKLRTSMQTASGFGAARTRSPNLKAAYTACGQDLAPVARAACKDGVATRNWRFIGSGECDDEVRANAPQYCRFGASTSPDPQYYALCSRYVSITRGTAAAPANAPPPAPAPAPAAQDPVSKGVDAVRKLLPF